MTKYVIGIDEAGRGPLAGPVAVGAVLVPARFDWQLLPGVSDSKQLTARRREELYLLASQLQKQGKLHYAVAMTSAWVIDRDGIVTAVNCGIKRALDRLEKGLHRLDDNQGSTLYANGKVLLDGGLKAPQRFERQETIIRGDATEPVISLASILAKVRRDRYMGRMCKGYPYTKYGFERHKGYGTAEHRALIKRYGLSDLHRRSFCQRILSLHT